MRSPQRIIGLWPEWLYGRQPDWPAYAETTGFVHYDGISTVSGGTDRAWDAAAGDAPIVFTAGTAMSQGPEFFAAAAGACAISKRPGLLLTQRPEQLPESLPEEVEHVAYAPFSELLPQAAAIVHHGGIGTAARAVKAGIPQLIVPHAYDQFDNCQRFADLGLAAELAQEELSAETLAAALDRLLGSSIIADRCRRYATMVDSAEGLERTCELLEGLVGKDS
jgi:UDP:flavonoid glycosyltransferase YjiC (YdhE family)